MKTLEEKYAEQTAEFSRMKILEAVRRTAEEEGRWHDPMIAAQLLAEKLMYDVDTRSVSGRDGRSIEQMLGSLAITSSYHLKATSGTQATDKPEYLLADIFGKRSKAMLAQKLYHENPILYLDMKKAARKEGLI